jgi:hypothetical protein
MIVKIVTNYEDDDASTEYWEGDKDVTLEDLEKIKDDPQPGLKKLGYERIDPNADFTIHIPCYSDPTVSQGDE